VHLQPISLLNHLEAFTAEIRTMEDKWSIWLWADEAAAIRKRMHDGDDKGSREGQNAPDLS
jgi:hypothetical protein